MLCSVGSTPCCSYVEARGKGGKKRGESKQINVPALCLNGLLLLGEECQAGACC